MCERMIENTIFKELMKRINKIIDFLAKHSRLLIKNYHTHIHTYTHTHIHTYTQRKNINLF